MKFSLSPLKVLAAAVVTACSLLNSHAQYLAPGATWLYKLTDGSKLVDDCPVCDRLPIVVPIRGSFELRLLHQGPLFIDYAIENLWLTNAGSTGPKYQVAGHGVFTIGGEVASRQSLSLEVFIQNEFTNQLIYLATNFTGVTRWWPMVQIGVDQTNGTLTQQYHLDLNAAPLREVWVSTADDFVAGVWQPPTNVVSNGDLLSTGGRTVVNNAELTRPFIVQPPVPDLGLKDFDILAGGEVVFSVDQPAWSEALGQMLGPGDLLSRRGRVVRTNKSLLAAFNPDPAATGGYGLAAIKSVYGTETWFSVQTNFYSKALGTTITSGDLLSDTGAMIRRNAQLLAPFKPVDPATDAGLRAAYVWPNGEIWFFVEKGFSDANATRYDPGDLLSDQGYVVYRNTELLSAFAPVGGTNVPIDGLWVVTDVLPESPAPVLSSPKFTNNPPAAVVSWDGPGHVFQLEKATNVAGPFTPAAPIEPDTSAMDAGAPTNSLRTFYRVRQW